ncbi:MAG: hypothetical protein DRJ97_04535 [Thermoprotei archaeon]|nr:MAG: hypothetical protein DRJ97_04535 [Thermoprotei archaeon]
MDEKPLVINSLIKGDQVHGYYVEALPRPGVLWKILDVFRKYNVNVLSINFSPTPSPEKPGLIFIVAEAKGLKDVEERLMKDVEEVEEVVSIEREEAKPLGLLIDQYHFPIVNGLGLRCLLTDEKAYEASLKLVKEHLGSPGLALLYHEGRAIGLGYARLLKELGVEDLKDLVTICLAYAKSHGAFKGELIEYNFNPATNKGRLVLRIYDLWECETAKRSGVREPSSHKTRGMIAGLIEGFVGKRASVKEDKCIAKGDKYCQFTVEI